LDDAAEVTITAHITDTTPSARGDGAITKKVLVDTIAPDAPSGLTVSIKHRRETTMTLGWLAPADGGQRVYTYDVRYATAPIATQPQFDAAPRAFYHGVPAMPGSADAIDVPGLLIEREYDFALRAVDAAGNQSDFVPAPTGATAHFQRMVLQSPLAPALDNFGYALAGINANGDAYSDLVVGSFNGSRLYIYFGAPSGYAAAPSVTFIGPAGSNFGANAANVGDIDGDGVEDLAISAVSDFGGDGAVYLFHMRSAWPAVLDTTMADYVIRGDSQFDPGILAGNFGYNIARLGDFNGDGANDFALTAAQYTDDQGYAAIVLGVRPPQTFPHVLKAPTDVASGRLINLYGQPGSYFAVGEVALGLGPAFGHGRNPFLTAEAGEVGLAGAQTYVFYGGAPPLLDRALADETLPGQRVFGQNSVWNCSLPTHVGWLLGGPVIAIGSPAPSGNANQVDVYFPGAGPLLTAPHVTIRDTLEDVSARDFFGLVMTGGGFSGTADNVSFIGTSAPDLWVSGFGEGPAGTSGKIAPSQLYLLDGLKLQRSIGSTLQVPADADVVLAVPADWAGNFLAATLPDMDGDGFADLAVSEVNESTYDAVVGRVLVVY
jgi:hypothetical protein